MFNTCCSSSQKGFKFMAFPLNLPNLPQHSEKNSIAEETSNSYRKNFSNCKYTFCGNQVVVLRGGSLTLMEGKMIGTLINSKNHQITLLKSGPPLEMIPIWLNFLSLFDTSPLTEVSKFNNFLWVCWKSFQFCIAHLQTSQPVMP